MIINKINLEGLASKESLKEYSLKEGEIFNEVVSIDLSNTPPLKEIIEINLESNILHKRSLPFKDGVITTLTVSTLYKILALEEGNTNKLSFINHKSFFTFILKGRSLEDKNITIDLVDCYFKLQCSRQITGSLTFYINIIDEESSNIDDVVIEKSTYKFIDIFREIF